jgi:XTP/dITP diphosphohydrolase
MPIVLATANPHKVDELRRIFADIGVEVIGLDEASAGRGGALAEPAETGTTFEENATIKAKSYAAQLGMACLADDSGLEIDALQGAPGVISSHYATDGLETGISRAERDKANNDRVLRELHRIPDHRRTARFVCVMCLAAADGKVQALTRGAFEGRIGMPEEVPRGSNGFGYDPLFFVAPEFARTSAELSAEEKNNKSHRGVAARAMAQRLHALAMG